jgi:bifunctional non-homologous end joining protein LigD
MPRTASKRAAAAVLRSQPVWSPSYIAPCQATNIGRPPAGNGWLHEIKHDGFRSQIHLRDAEVVIYSKRGFNWTERYDSVAQHAAKLRPRQAVIDGEMVVLREDGASDLWALQGHVRGSKRSENLAFFAVDLLFLDGEDLRRLPLVKRKQRLQQLIAALPGSAQSSQQRLFYTEHIDACPRLQRGEHSLQTS